MESLNEGTLLEELHLRYNKDVIYTYVGEILVAMNPYKMIGDMYGEANQKKYCNGVDKTSVPPHIFAVGDNSFEALKSHGKDQVCVISGESGAGKTESAKLYLKHIIPLSTGAEHEGLADKIIMVNPLLEAFGNAQTVMNDNSSRFGKFLDLRFNADLAVRGAYMTEYLLEKSRVVSQAEGERNFHIFYYLFASLSDAEKAKYEVNDVHNYRFINGNDSALADIGGAKNVELWKEVCDCIDVVGFTQDERESLFALLHGILHLGNVEFGGDEAAEITSGAAVLNSACNQLGVSGEAMELALTTLVTIVRGEEMIKNYKPFEAEDVRDATAKSVYGHTFQWIFKRVNHLLSPGKSDDKDKKISFLDIFGFENFDENSFEQLCINLANEQLQFFFNNHIFRMELDEYAREGIDGSTVTYEDNQHTLDMILVKRTGLFALLDEECNIPRSSDKTLLEKLHKQMATQKSYERPKGPEEYFYINHYAGKVKYEVYGFLEKDRDTLPLDVMAALRISENILVHALFGSDGDDAKAAKAARGRKAGKGKGADRSASRKDMRKSMKKLSSSLAKKKKLTSASEFKGSLEKLMVSLNAAEPHFIRCLKPNSVKEALNWDPELVTKQLRYTGMLETTRIRREGYAVRPNFEDFMHRFGPLSMAYGLTATPNAGCARALMEASGLKDWQIGKTKVFLRYYHPDMLNDLQRPIQSSAANLQKVCRGFMARKALTKLQVAKADVVKKVESFVGSCERAASAQYDALQSICEEDDKRPADFWSKPAPELYEKEEKTSQAKAKKKKAVGRRQSVKWVEEQKDQHVKGDGMGGFASWFAGVMSRSESVELLNGKPTGTFLIRVSETRYGFSLSAVGPSRMMHFMVDQNESTGKFIVVGNARKFDSLVELIEHHQRYALTDDGFKLGDPCPQDAERLKEFM